MAHLLSRTGLAALLRLLATPRPVVASILCGLTVTGTGNALIGNDKVGVAIFSLAATRLEKNVAIGNRADGFLSASPTTYVKNNADDNMEDGIEAMIVTDGGGNKARDDVGMAQCMGVACQ